MVREKNNHSRSQIRPTDQPIHKQFAILSECQASSLFSFRRVFSLPPVAERNAGTLQGTHLIFVYIVTNLFN